MIEKRERWIVLLLLGLFLLFNICTATRYPFPNVDECMIAEPAINFIHGKNFHVRFSEILAMYSFLLVPWLKLFGVSLRSIRSANMTCATVGLFVLWTAVKRLGVITQASQRLLLLLLLTTEFGMIFAYRTGRYDGFGCLIMSVLLLACSLQTRQLRIRGLFLVSLFLPWAGPQYLVALFAAAIVCCLIFRLRYWVEIAVSFLASGLGAIGFLAAVDLSGRLARYRDFLSIQQRGGTVFEELIVHGRLINHNFLPKDFSLPFLLLAAAVAWLSLARTRPKPQYWALCFGILFCFVLSASLISIAKFPTYYSYLVVMPLSVAVIAGLSVLSSKSIKYACLALCLGSAFAGAGLNAISYASDARDHQYAMIEGFVNQSLRSDDVVYVDSEAYLPARQRTVDAYFPNPDLDVISKMSQKQKSSITVLMIQPSWIPDAARILGGRWQETGQELVPTGDSVFGRDGLGFISWSLKDLRVLRRVPGA